MQVFYSIMDILRLMRMLFKEHWHLILFIIICIYSTNITMKIEQNLNNKTKVYQDE